MGKCRSPSPPPAPHEAARPYQGRNIASLPTGLPSQQEGRNREECASCSVFPFSSHPQAGEQEGIWKLLQASRRYLLKYNGRSLVQRRGNRRDWKQQYLGLEEEAQKATVLGLLYWPERLEQLESRSGCSVITKPAGKKMEKGRGCRQAGLGKGSGGEESCENAV